MLHLRFALACFSMMFASAAWAEDVALLLGDRSVSVEDGGAAQMAEPLAEAGFRMITPEDQTLLSYLEAAERLETALAQGDVDRLVIAAMGPVVSDGAEDWLLVGDVARVSRIGLGARALSLNALTRLTEGRGIPVVVLLAPEAPPEPLPEGLVPGPAAIAEESESSIVLGAAEAFPDLLRDVILVRDLSFRDLAARAPDGVVVLGNQSARLGLMGPVDLSRFAEAEELGFWRAVEAIGAPEGYAAYLDAYPEGRFQQEARARLQARETRPEDQARLAEQALNLSREDRQEIQRDLGLLGYDTRGIDGIFGQGTRQAIYGWQRDNQFPETGFVTGNQRIRMRVQAREEAARQEEVARQRRSERERQDREYWIETGRGAHEDGLRAYLEQFPDGEFSDLAEGRLAEIEARKRAEVAEEERYAWVSAREADTEEHYRAFLNSYPNSPFASDAQARLQELRRARRNAALVAEAQREERLFVSTRVTRRLIESRLKKVGAKPGKVDGEFTDQTRRAIRRFQRSRKLPVTGFVSQQTMVSLLGGR